MAEQIDADVGSGASNNLSSSASSGGRSHISCGIPTPPFAPPCIKFNPPLSIQRRVEVHELLKKFTREYENPVQSLLEIGCGGNTPLMQTLLSCDDELPLSILSGIDIDDQLFSIGVDSAFTTCEYGDDDRWRDLTVSLLHGSFEDISLQNIGPFDAITSCEVIEHLDPGPLTSFAPILLGRMNPRVFIVTTPNRDFNSLFEMPYESLDDMKGDKPYVWNPHDDPAVAGRRYYREPHKYAMRHHDHRFEWTRAEFQMWGNNAAERFGYSVSYHGCGALHDGAEILATRWRVEEALRRQIKSQNINIPPGRSIDTELLQEVFGHCSQVAIFIRSDSREKSLRGGSSLEEQLFMKELTPMSALVNNHIKRINQLPIELRLVKYHTFAKASIDHSYPPTLLELFELQRLTIKHLLPIEIQRVWQYGHSHSKPTKYDYERVVIQANVKALWDMNYKVRRACRFHLPMFEYLVANCVESERLDAIGSGDGSLISLQNLTDEFGKLMRLALDLEPVQEYEFVTSKARSDPNSDSMEMKKGSLESSSGLKIISTTPIIAASIYWSTDPSTDLSVPEQISLQGAMIDKISDDKILRLAEPVETMKELEKRQKIDGHATKPSISLTSSRPIALVFIRPKEIPSPQEQFDYEKQRRERFENTLERGYDEMWDRQSENENNLEWDATDSEWGDKTGRSTWDDW
ncbi:hypothetical protein H072_1285 [Dactylellina haptotyla CBS 200.50]|uniref:Small RNA 2'-O-methyltransferase n=1 Tax=Dactylellina haptotyla (strain CBS 200.50) TaxID=1284197 RepID=S8AUY9_DACHA|nr:hypothetical protein H072_1285 [Dactylellina haptotyla CBS 200.50]